MEFAAGFALTVLSSGIWLVAGYVKLYLPSEEQYGMQPCGVPGTVEKPCWGPAFTSGCRLPLCPAQPLPPQLLTNLPHCVLTWFVMARITSYNGSALCLGLNDILMVTSFLEGSFCRSCHISPTLRTACWLSCLLYDFPKVDSDGVLHSVLAVLVGMGAHHTMPVVSLLFLRTVLCSPWKKMFLESSCTESSTSGHFEDFETSIHRLNEKYILCWFLSLQACELEDTWLVAAAMVKFCSCISFFNCPYHYAVKLLQDWEWERKRADCKQVPTRNFNLVLSICFSVDIYCLETGYSHLSRRFASWAVK